MVKRLLFFLVLSWIILQSSTGLAQEKNPETRPSYKAITDILYRDKNTPGWDSYME